VGGLRSIFDRRENDRGVSSRELRDPTQKTRANLSGPPPPSKCNHPQYEGLQLSPAPRKRPPAREFADARRAAEVVAVLFAGSNNSSAGGSRTPLLPQPIQLHNYPPASSTAQKLANWQTLAARALVPLLGRAGAPSAASLAALAAAQPGAAERLLLALRRRAVRAEEEEGEEQAAEEEERREAEQRQRALERVASAEAAAAATAATGAGERAAAVAPAGEVRCARCELLEAKCRKLEELLRVKDARIAAFSRWPLPPQA